MQFSCGSQQLNKTSTLSIQRLVQPKRTSKVQANREIYLPGGDATIPDYLDGSLPGDRGFDPLRLSQNPTVRSWLANGELYNARWAMLGSVGILAASINIKIQTGSDAAWWDTKLFPFPFVEFNGTYTQFPVFTAQWFVFIVLEFLRIKDWWNPDGSQTSPNGNYPGGNFDPLNFASNAGPEEFRSLQEKEIRNGRLAMASWFAYNAQHYSTGKGPLDNLFEHLSDPAKNNITKYGLHPPTLPDFTVPS